MNELNRILLLIAIGIILNGCSGKSDYELLQTQQTVKEYKVTAASIEYKILPQDRLKVVLYKDPGQISELQAQKIGEEITDGGILVNASGYIKIPLVGKVKVVGLNQTEAAERIEKLYRHQLTDPSVYVEIMNKRLFVLGEVNKQGVVAIDKEKMTLFEALAFSGGFTDSAVKESIIIVSHNQSGMHIRKVDLTNYDTMSYASLMLRPNDIVYVQPNYWKKFKVASDDYTSAFTTVAKVAAPFVTLKYLAD